MSYPILSQRLESVPPMLAFISSAFVSLGKHRTEENPSHKILCLPEPLCGYFMEGDGMREMLKESQREKQGLKSDHDQTED